jgi:hypothetical protein
VAITINATPKDPAANSWAPFEEAEVFFAEDFDSSPWDDANDEVRKKAMIAAFYRLEQERYRGERTDSLQAASMPRIGLRTRDGIDVDPNTIHVSCKRAQFELMREILRSNILKPDALKNFETLSKPGTAMTPRFKLDGQLPDAVVRELSWVRITVNRMQRA